MQFRLVEMKQAAQRTKLLGQMWEEGLVLFGIKKSLVRITRHAGAGISQLTNLYIANKEQKIGIKRSVIKLKTHTNQVQIRAYVRTVPTARF